MRNNSNLRLAVAIIASSSFFYSCQKSIDKPAALEEINTSANVSKGQGVTPYKFERVNEHNFSSQGWREQQINNPLAGGPQIFSDESDYVQIVCGPENNSDPRLIQGSITMNLPTSGDPTLRRIRLRKAGYSGTLLADLTELKYSTYVVQKAPTALVLQVDINNDDVRDFNMFFDPALPSSGIYTPVQLNTWEQWDALHGTWYYEISTISGLPEKSTIAQLVALYPDARIIDTPPVGHNGEGVRFTIGGNPRNLFDNTIGYFDALIIGTKNEQVSTLYDFTCNQGND